MQDLLLLLIGYFIIGLIVNMSTSTLVQIIKPFVNLQKYALVIASVVSALIITSYNQGILTTLEVPQAFSIQPYFHFVDLGVSSIIFAKGSQAVHKIIEGIEMYRSGKK